LQVRLLGTAAGGGFPQWNCRCAGCEKARQTPSLAIPRTQSSVAISADSKNWFLLNVSPDIRHQIAAFPDLLPPPSSVRGSALQGILITNADLDHTLGLFILREGNPLSVHAPSSVREALSEGIKLSAVLDAYSGIRWHEPPHQLQPLLDSNGSPSGLLLQAFGVPGKMPRYYVSPPAPSGAQAVGYRLVDEKTGGKLVFIPDIASFDGSALEQMKDCDLLLLDGTFWSENEMKESGAGTLTATQMAHVVIGGPRGSLAQIKNLPAKRKIYLHINNTNPILVEGSPEQMEVKAAGIEVGHDGVEIAI